MADLVWARSDATLERSELHGPVVWAKTRNLTDVTDKYAVLMGIVTVDGEREALIKDRTTGKDYRLRRGEKVTLGTFEGIVGQIGDREVEFVVNGGRDSPIRVGLGEALRKSDAAAGGPARRCQFVARPL